MLYILVYLPPNLKKNHQMIYQHLISYIPVYFHPNILKILYI
jgi:hypothetical protein